MTGGPYMTGDTVSSLPRPGEDPFRLASLTPAELSQVTTAAAGRPVRDPHSRVTALPYDSGSPATAGLWRVEVHSGPGQDALAYTYFVKLLRHPRLWPGLRHFPDEASRQEFAAYLPWLFELDMAESGISRVLPPGMRTPVLHHVRHTDADHVALWWEYVSQRPGPWRLPDYQRAARLLGRLAARRRAGAAVNEFLPERCRSTPPGGALRGFVERRVMQSALPELQAGQIWTHPVAAAALRRAADPALPADLLSLGARIRPILDMLDRLPQTYAHGDASPQNLLLPVHEPDAVVVIDWGFGSLLPVGFDLGQLLVGLAHAGQAMPSDLAGIDAVIFPAYLDGLRAESYEAEPGQVRAGYIGSLVARSALCSLPLELLGGPPGEEAEELFRQRLQLTRTLVDMAAEITVTAPA
jgi:hypothetical protein